ncbi:MAG: hypothetical protein AAF974_08680, partial [Cyanobacteria bacterium P01_E01_bin.34]
MKHYICGAVCGALAAAAVWLSGGDIFWHNSFNRLPSNRVTSGTDSFTTPLNEPAVSGSHISDSAITAPLFSGDPISEKPHSYSPITSYRTAHASETQSVEESISVEIADQPSSEFISQVEHTPQVEFIDRAEHTAQVESEAAIACMGTVFGASCLSETGEWELYTPDNSPLTAADIHDVAICSNGAVVFAHAGGLDILRDDRWTAISKETWEGSSPVTVVECLNDGTIWVGYDKGLSQFDGSDWTHFDRSVLGTTASGPIDMAGDSNNQLWVLTSHSIALFDGRNWTTYAPGAGLPQQDTGLVGIAIGENGRPRARDGDFNRSLRFTGEGWVVRDVDQPPGVTGFAIDARDSEWIGSEEEGAWVYSRGGAVVQDRDSSNLSSNQVLAIDTDTSGRTWLGTSWGLNVFDGREWIAY